MQDFKEKVYAYCLDFVKNKIKLHNQQIEEAQQTANNETKSSAGDKYETTRAMMQIEIEKEQIRLLEAQKLLQTLFLIDINKSNATVNLGSLVKTNKGLFFLAIGIGPVEIQQQKVFVISSESPIGKQMWQKLPYSNWMFNNALYEIERID
ncbi:MAG: hypothetical protein EAZ57_07520 [Cytophagales bacterium]|nr:MAG: hypothetical protein EAZ67_08605 [Cytophagales bacterium]TAF60387.1 MAG: hypothetical protein EAZ57_07520 [Cytophagales bacterium]